MNNLVSLFDNIQEKIMNNFYKNNISKNITDSEGKYLNIIFNLKSSTLSKFAEKAKITKPAATQIINKYIDKGYVIKKVSASDKRVCYIELTEQLKKCFNDGYKKFNKLYNEYLSFLTDEEKDTLNTLLLKINDNL